MSSEIARLITAEIAGYKAKIEALEAALLALDGAKPVKKTKTGKVDGRKGRVWTAEQKAAASERRKATLASKAA